MSLLALLLAAGPQGGSALVWHEGELVLKGEPGKVEFFRVPDPVSCLLRLESRSPAPPALAGVEPTESRPCAPGVVELPREKGLYLAKCGDASALAVKSSLALVCVADGETVVAFCAGSSAGAPRPGAELSFLARGKVLLSGVADRRGLFEVALAGPMTVVARDGDDLAFAVLRGLAPPSPPPVGMVAVPGGAAAEGSPLLFFGLIPRDAGRLLPVRAPGFEKALVRADATGVFAGRLEPGGARPGRHALRVGSYGVEFDVVREEEEGFELGVEAPENVAPGEEVEVKVAAREPFGPAVESTFSYRVVEERPGRGARLVSRGRGEGKGSFSFTFPARAAGIYRVVIDAREKGGRRTASAETIIRCGKGLALRVEPLYVRAGENAQVRVTGASGKVRLEDLCTERRLVSLEGAKPMHLLFTDLDWRTRELDADAEGRARATLSFDRRGTYTIRALCGGEKGQGEVRALPTKFEALSITPASKALRPGREGRALVEGGARAALVVCASDRLWWAKVVSLEDGWAEARFRALDGFGPRVDLSAFAFRDGRLERAGCALRVERGLSLAFERRGAEMRLRALDVDGRPVRASVVAFVRVAGGELPVPVDGLAPGFPAHVEVTSSFDFASGGGGITREMRAAPRRRASAAPAVPARAARSLRVERLIRTGPALEASFPIAPRETRGKRELIAYAFGEGGRCAVARALLAEEKVWGCVRAPRYLVEGDEIWAELRLWNDSAEKVEPEPNLRGEGVELEAPPLASLSAGEDVSVPFLLRAPKRGKCVVSTRFGSREIDVLARGLMEMVSHSGVLEEDAAFTLATPRAARERRLTIAFAPTAADALALARPSEQGTLEPEDLPRLFSRMDESGGYGWHGSPSDALSTALAVLRLKELLPDSAATLSRALDSLATLARAESHEWRGAFAAYALARCGRDPGRIRASSALGLAYAALAEEERGRHARAVELCGRLEAMAERGGGGVHWGRKRARSETGSEELSTAAALRALLRVAPGSELIREACVFLLASKKGASWGGGAADREALAALEEFARSRPKEELAGLTVAASEAGLTRLTVRAEGRELSKDIVWRRELPAGEPMEIALARARRVRVELSKTGPGRIPFSAWVEYRTPRAGGELRVERRYSSLRPRKGEVIECSLRVRARGGFERAIVRDFVPGGFEVATAGGAELSPPEIVFYVPRLRNETVLRYALRARFRGRFTALAPLVTVEGTGLRGRGEEVSLEVGY